MKREDFMDKLKKIYDKLTYLHWNLQNDFDEFVFMTKIEPKINELRDMVQSMMKEMKDN
jgi:hypothetical protein